MHLYIVRKGRFMSTYIIYKQFWFECPAQHIEASLNYLLFLLYCCENLILILILILKKTTAFQKLYLLTWEIMCNQDHLTIYKARRYMYIYIYLLPFTWHHGINFNTTFRKNRKKYKTETFLTGSNALMASYSSNLHTIL